MSTQELIDRFMEKLNSFDSSQDLADFLTEERVKGYKADSDSCVISNWLEDKTGFDVSTEDEIRFYSFGQFGEVVSVRDISQVVKNFIEEFDEGKHPQLDWETYF